MKMKIKLFSLLLWVLGINGAFCQMQQYQFQRELIGISDQWHRIVLPDDIYGHLSGNLSDIRIFGITSTSDTIEAPFLLQTPSLSAQVQAIPFELINASRREQEYYFTFLVPTDQTINQIKLDFKQTNFDWKVKLEGSQNQQQWFTIIEDYRILSIDNDQTQFSFTNISFPPSNYRYLRLKIPSEVKHEMITTQLSSRHFPEINWKTYDHRQVKTQVNNETHQTQIAIVLGQYVPVSMVRIQISDTFDFYRPISIRYLSDSFNTEMGWKYRYTTLNNSILNSLDSHSFTFSSTVLKHLNIGINNTSNQPLSIEDVAVMGFPYELVARFVKPATYYLTYGNTEASNPTYDIAQFTDRIPTVMTTLELGREEPIQKEKKIANLSFFNTHWLWVVMGFIIIILGVFSIKMIRTK